MANIASHVGRTRAAVGRLIEAYLDAKGCLTEYASLGGRDAVHPYFVTGDAGTPRTDLDITEQQYVDAVASIVTIDALIVQGHNTNLYRVRG